MKRERLRLRAVGRWGVWVCTCVLLGMIGVSVFYYTSITLISTKPKPAARRLVWVVYSQHGRLGFEHGFATSKEFGLETLWRDETRYRFDMERVRFELTQDFPQAWWRLPYKESARNAQGGFYLFEIPMVYPAVAFVLWSLLLVRSDIKRRRRLAGCCVGCGYSLEGLKGRVCPECGAGEC